MGLSPRIGSLNRDYPDFAERVLAGMLSANAAAIAAGAKVEGLKRVPPGHEKASRGVRGGVAGGAGSLLSLRLQPGLHEAANRFSP